MTRIGLLGHPSAEVSGVAVPGIERTPKKLAILAYLALHPAQRFVSRESLLTQFWPESPERPARHALSQSLHFIRQTFGADALITSGTQLVRLNPNSIALDVREFEAAIDRNGWQDAAQLYRGDLLEGVTLEDSEAADWLDRERQRLRARAADALWQHATALLEPDAEAAVSVAERAITCDPIRESACLAFLEAAAQQKRINAVRTIAASFRSALARATGGDAPTPSFSERVRELQTVSVDEIGVNSEPAPIVPPSAEVSARIVALARPRRWLAAALLLALVASAALAARTITVRMAGASEAVHAAIQFVIQPIEAPEELRPFADGIVAHIADELNANDWDVILSDPTQTAKPPAGGYGFVARAYRTGDTAELSYQVSDVASGQIVTSGVLPFDPKSDVVDVGAHLIKKIRVEMGRSHPVSGNLSASERAAWERVIHQQSLADSLRNVGDFNAAAHAYGVLDSLYTAERWSARVALMFGVQRLRGRRAFVLSEFFRGDMARVNSLVGEAELIAADLVRRFPDRFEAREARGLVRYQRVQFQKATSLAQLDSAIAELRPRTGDAGSAEGLSVLSGLFLRKGDWAAARAYALAATERDKFLEYEKSNLIQLYEALFNLGEDEPARGACTDINDRFPREGLGVSCRLDLMAWSDIEPLDTAEARRIAREGNANDPPLMRESMERHSKLLLAAVLFRAGDLTEARRLVNSVDVSTDVLLVPTKAAVLARLGDSTRARELAASFATRGDLERIALDKGRKYKGLVPPR